VNRDGVFARAVWTIFMFRALTLTLEIVVSYYVHLNCETFYRSILETVHELNLSKSHLKTFSVKLSPTEESTFEHTVEPSAIEIIIIIIDR
jgi:hypothetical protein